MLEVDLKQKKRLFRTVDFPTTEHWLRQPVESLVEMETEGMRCLAVAHKGSVQCILCFASFSVVRCFSVQVQSISHRTHNMRNTAFIPRSKIKNIKLNLQEETLPYLALCEKALCLGVSYT